MAKRYGKKKFMRAPSHVTSMKKQVLERNGCRCCNCNKPIEKSTSSLFLKEPHKKGVELTPDKMKVMCLKCAKKYGIPYVNPNKSPKPKKDEEKPISLSKLMRKNFTEEQRKEILKSTYNICACCGKKLDIDTMTVEHIIPLSIGGSNKKENLTALCKECNSAKNNDLYLADGFYSALINKPRFQEITRYVDKWIELNKGMLDISHNPMISPKFNVFHVPFGLIHNYNKLNYSKQFMYQYSLVTPKEYDFLRHLTGIKLEDMRDEANEQIRTLDKDVVFYTCKKASTNKVFMVFAVLYDMKRQRLVVTIPWSNLKNENTNTEFSYLMISNLCSIITNTLKQDIKELYIKHHKDNIQILLVSLLERNNIITGGSA